MPETPSSYPIIRPEIESDSVPCPRLFKKLEKGSKCSLSLTSASLGDMPEPSSFRKRFDCCAHLHLFVLIMILLLGTPLSAWAEETPLQPPTHGEDVSDAADRVTNRPYVFLANDNLPPMTYMQDGKLIGILVDLAEAIKKHINRPVHLQYMEWSQAQQYVLDGKADAVLHINS